jgi:hypothetical protein
MLYTNNTPKQMMATSHGTYRGRNVYELATGGYAVVIDGERYDFDELGALTGYLDEQAEKNRTASCGTHEAAG